MQLSYVSVLGKNSREDGLLMPGQGFQLPPDTTWQHKPLAATLADTVTMKKGSHEETGREQVQAM